MVTVTLSIVAPAGTLLMVTGNVVADKEVVPIVDNILPVVATAGPLTAPPVAVRNTEFAAGQMEVKAGDTVIGVGVATTVTLVVTVLIHPFTSV